MNKNITTEYWMKIVEQVAQASTCRIKVATVLVMNNRIKGVGYTGSIPGDFHCDEVGCLLVDSPHQGSDESGKGCRRTLHSELNAILNTGSNGLDGIGIPTAYMSLEPCLLCFKALYTFGIRRFYYAKPYKDIDRMLYMASLSKHIWNDLIWVYVPCE